MTKGVPEARVELARGCPRWILSSSEAGNRGPSPTAQVLSLQYLGDSALSRVVYTSPEFGHRSDTGPPSEYAPPGGGLDPGVCVLGLVLTGRPTSAQKIYHEVRAATSGRRAGAPQRRDLRPCAAGEPAMPES